MVGYSVAKVVPAASTGGFLVCIIDSI